MQRFIPSRPFSIETSEDCTRSNVVSMYCLLLWAVTMAASLQPAVAQEAFGLVTDGAYAWFLNGDGTRNWLETIPPDCKELAKSMPRSEIDAIPKRHGGSNAAGYGLSGDDAKRACFGFPTSVVGLVTDGAYYWHVNADGSRNWLRSVPQACKSRARRMERSKIDPYTTPSGHKIVPITSPPSKLCK